MKKKRITKLTSDRFTVHRNVIDVKRSVQDI
jgi:hypothetical protein